MVAPLDLTPDELLTTTRAVRRRLDLTRPVARETVEECLRLAFQAPNGSNQQSWDWVVYCFDDTGKIAYLTEHWNTWHENNVLFDNFDMEPAHPLA